MNKWPHLICLCVYKLREDGCCSAELDFISHATLLNAGAGKATDQRGSCFTGWLHLWWQRHTCISPCLTKADRSDCSCLLAIAIVVDRLEKEKNAREDARVRWARRRYFDRQPDQDRT